MRMTTVTFMLMAITVACVSSVASAQTSQGLTGTLDNAQSQITRQGDTTKCGTATATTKSTVVCPGGSAATHTAASQLKLSYKMSDGSTYSKCVWIDNNATKSYFVPLNTYKEWIAFYNAATSNTNLKLQVTDCTAAATGTCGTANDTDVTTAPAASSLCGASNTASTTTYSTTDKNWTWTCTPTSGGTPKNCSTLTQCSPKGSLYVWNGMNWDDYLEPNWNMSWVGGSMSLPPEKTNTTIYAGRGLYWNAPGTSVSCGPLASTCDNDVYDGLAAGKKYCSGVSRSETGCIMIYSGYEDGSSMYLNPIYGISPADCASGMLTPDSGFQYGEYGQCSTKFHLMNCSADCVEYYQSTCQ